MVDTGRHFADVVSSPAGDTTGGGSVYRDIVQQQQKDAQQNQQGNSHHLHHWYDGIVNVAEDVAHGAIDEVCHHPMELLKDAAIGAAAGAVFVLAGPEVTAAASLAALGAAGYEVLKNAPLWIHDAKVAADPSKYSTQEQQAATQGLENIGAGATQLAAGFSGALVGGFAAGAGKDILFSGKTLSPAQESADLASAADNSFNQAVDHIQILSSPKLMENSVKNGALDAFKQALLDNQPAPSGG